MSLAARTAAAAGQGGPRFLDRRFDSAGAEVPCPGNTVIAHIRDAATLDLLAGAQARLAGAAAGDCFAWLPRASLHCTLFNGLLYADRAAADWPRTLANDAPRAAADAHLRAGWEAAALPEAPVSMRPARFSGFGSDALGLGLDPLPGSDGPIRAYRDRLADQAGLAHRAGHAAYAFHITFAYLIRWPAPAEAEAFDRRAAEVLADLQAACPVIPLAASELCTFAGMTHFQVLASKPLPQP